MGSARPKPKRLPKKLLQVRDTLDGGISQNELIRRMKLENELGQERISKYGSVPTIRGKVPQAFLHKFLEIV